MPRVFALQELRVLLRRQDFRTVRKPGDRAIEAPTRHLLSYGVWMPWCRVGGGDPFRLGRRAGPEWGQGMKPVYSPPPSSQQANRLPWTFLGATDPRGHPCIYPAPSMHMSRLCPALGI